MMTVNRKLHEASRGRIVITYPFPLGGVSGGARMTREIARHLGRLGADVVILPVSARPGRRYLRPEVADQFLGFEFDAELAKDSVDIVRVPQHPLYWRLDSWSVKRATKHLLKGRQVDMVLSYYHEAACLPSFLGARGIKFGYIATWQSYAMALNPATPTGGIREWLRKRLDDHCIIKPYRQADILFATSHFTRQELMDIVGVDGHRIVVCYLGVDPGFMEIPRSVPAEMTRFIFFGRIIPSKGISDAIEALGQLAARGLKNWTYRILGQGNHDWARNLAREHGIGDQVQVCDPVDDEGLRRELKQAHLAIMPSHAESFGLSIAEASAAGIPVVAYEAGSVPEVVAHGVTGWLAPLRQVDRLAQYIEGAVQNPGITYQAGLAGRERVKRMFTWDKTAKTILEGIETIR